MSKEESEASIQNERTEFDQFFNDYDEEFVLKLYEIPKGQKRKEWIQDYYNVIPDDEQIATDYAEGHFVVMGKDTKGNIKSKTIFISHRAAERIQKANAEKRTAEVGTTAVGNISNVSNQNNNIEGQLLQAIIKAIPQLIGGRTQVSPVDNMREQMQSITQMFVTNMEKINEQIMGHTKKLVNEKLAIEPEKPHWVQEAVQSIAPFLDTFLKSKGVEEKIIKTKIENDDQYKKLSQDPEKINEFYNVLADTVGETKADQVMSKLGYDIEPSEKDTTLSDNGAPKQHDPAEQNTTN